MFVGLLTDPLGHLVGEFADDTRVPAPADRDLGLRNEPLRASSIAAPERDLGQCQESVGELDAGNAAPRESDGAPHGPLRAVQIAAPEARAAHGEVRRRVRPVEAEAVLEAVRPGAVRQLFGHLEMA